MKQGLTGANFNKFDKSNMLDLLLDFPEQCRTALDIAKKARISFEKKDFNKIVFVGVGASAIGADLVKSYSYFKSSIPILVLREYDLPASVDNSTLVIISSYSGDTEETLQIYEQAKKRNVALIAISSGGALRDRALEDKINFVEIPKGFPPRCALGYASIIPLCILSRLGIIEDITFEINQVVRVLDELKDNNLGPAIALSDNIAKSSALKIWNKFAVIYTSSVHFDVCATRLRSQLAENSKALSSSHLFPEMNHNEIVGWKNPDKLFKNIVVVMLRDKDMHPRIAKRMDITRDILKKEEGIEVIEIWSRGENLLSRIFSLIYIGDFISYYLAISYGVDPTPIGRITYLKNELAKK